MDRSSSTSQVREQPYRTLFEHLPICVFMVSLSAPSAAILEANRRAGVVYGYTADEFVGMTVAQLVADDSSASAEAVLRRVREGETVTLEMNNRRRDGTIFPVRVVATLDPGDSGHMILVARDLSTEAQHSTEEEAKEAERLRIAREIHNGVTRIVAALRLESALWQELGLAAPPEMPAAQKDTQAVRTAASTDIRLQSAAAGTLNHDFEAVRPDDQIGPNSAACALGELNVDVPPEPKLAPLTESEMAVLRLVAQGAENEHIARSLNFSVHTVANRLRTIYEKLHVTNRTQAALVALRRGWASLDEPPT